MAEPDFLKALPCAELRAAGVPDPFAFGYKDRVRFGELDALGHVNHTAYLRWIEAFRVQYLAAYGISHYGSEDMQLVLKSVSVQYHAPMFLNQVYTITGRTAQFRTNGFQMEYGIWVDGQCCAECQAVIVSLEQDGRTKRPLRAAAIDAFKSRDQATAG